MSTSAGRAALAAALLCPTAAARADGDLPSPLSLAEVLSAVRGRNPRIAERRETARGATLRPRAEGLPEDPTASFEWWQQPVNFSSVPLMVTVKQTLPWPRTLRLRRELAEREGKTAHDDADQAERQTLGDAKRAYFDLVLAERSLEVSDRVRAIDRHLVEVTDALYRVGKAAQSHLFQAQSEVLTVENERLDLERGRDEATARLNALLDRPLGAPLGPTATPARLVPLPAEHDLIERALARRPAVERARHQLAALEARVAVEERRRLPEIAVWAAFMVNLGGVDTFTAGVSSTLPFFSVRRQKPLTEAAEADVAAARRALDAARREAELSVHTALLQLEAAERHAHLHTDKLIPLADLTLASAESSYQTGRTDFLAVLEAARMVRDHHLNHVKFLVEYRRRLADLEEVAGDLDEDGVTP